MRSKKFITTFTACALLLVSTGFVQANPFRSHTDGTYNLSSEKAANVEKIYGKGQTKIQPLRDNLYAKRLELNALAQNPNTKPETIKKITQEITELRKDIREQHEILSDSLEKETGTRNFTGSYHKNNRSNGHGHNSQSHHYR